jgi:glycosyltransferase involved in cell wall biosynthesis
MNKIKCSVIIPTKDRAQTLEGTLLELSKCAGIENTEIVLCNDGSVDDTAMVIQGFIETNPNIQVTVYDDGHHGVAFQRNRAAASAKGQVLIFAADDIRPLSSSWIEDHINLHIRQPSSEFAVLGKMTWPSSDALPTNFVMATVQGRGGEQFGFADLQANTYLDWRFFYTSNLSVKKSIVHDWTKDGFSLEFTGYGFEDIEFAYRMHGRNNLRLFYSSIPIALHFQKISVLEFCNRQRSAGSMAVEFVQLHPELEHFLTPKAHNIGDPKNISIILRLIDGLQAYVEWLEITGYLGTEEWHRDLLHSLFGVYFRLGIIEKYTIDDSSILSNELEGLLRTTLLNLSRNIGFTIFGNLVNFDPTTASKSMSSAAKIKYRVGVVTIPIRVTTIHRIVNHKLLRQLYLKAKKHIGIKKI